MRKINAYYRDSRKMWKPLNGLLNTSYKSNSTFETLVYDGSVVNDNTLIAKCHKAEINSFLFQMRITMGTSWRIYKSPLQAKFSSKISVAIVTCIFKGWSAQDKGNPGQKSALPSFGEFLRRPTLKAVN